MRWDHCKACNAELTEEDLFYDPRQELCKPCYKFVKDLDKEDQDE